jgi:hypothetical protein
MLDAVNGVLKSQPVVEEKQTPQLISEETVQEVSPPGWSGTVKAMKKHKNIDNPFALAWSMKNKGAKPHYKPEKKNEEVEIEEGLKDIAKKVGKALTGGSDEDQRKDLQRKMGVPQTGKKPEVKEDVEQIDEIGDNAALYNQAAKTSAARLNAMKSMNKTFDYEKKQTARLNNSMVKKEEVESVEEELKGNQSKIDANHNGKIDGQDFRILRGKKKVQEELKGNQKKIDKNHNNKIDPEDFKILRGEKKVEESWDDMVKDAKEKVKSGPKPNGGSGQKQGSSYGGSKQKEKPEHDEVKEAVDPSKKTVDTLAGRIKGGKDNEHVAYKVKLKTEAKTLSPGQDDVPFEEPYSPAPRNIKDKSGAVHTPMSRAKDLARTAMKRVKSNLKDKK